MSTTRWLGVPLGPEGPRWTTVAAERFVLVVVHTITAVNRFADILSVFDSDRRVQLVFTFPAASAVTADVEGYLAATGALVIPWDQAVSTKFHLALSVHNSGNLHEIDAPLIVLSHGMGYTKNSHRKPEAGSRKPEAGSRKPEAGSRSVYGLSREWLIHSGDVVPSAIVLSHEEQCARLGESVPEALSAAVVAGDPCFDRLVASEQRRSGYRRVLGAGDDTTVVVLTSTWGDRSLLGTMPDLPGHLLAELPVDRYVVAAVLHPNVWFAHGPHQIRLWLGDCLRAGLRLIPPAEGWQQALIASDVVIGDHGAVTGYGAALGRPTLLASFPVPEVAAGSAIDALGRTAARLDRRGPFEAQIRTALTDTATDRWSQVRDLTTSVPGRSADLLRRVFYDLMRLPEPSRTTLLPRYSVGGLVPEEEPVRAWWVAAEPRDVDEVVVTRWPADVLAREDQTPDAARHLVVAGGHPRRDLRGNAAIVVIDGEGDSAVEAVFDSRPSTVLVVAGDSIAHRDGTRLSVALADSSSPDGVIVCGSAIYGWLAAGRKWSELPETLTVRLGRQVFTACLTRPR
ncbi:hypothetical protein F4560_008690 [Saccharothrix ecbatanensis]|uniref:Uncharacterized protein n=1 Tax=Saccharothrix ecbatanensis TaxID=1105145 RepID=A0A7W9HUT3_9PSEU|nr:hypothetical protein [Saccharothrix ecbatanensis]MBB5808922.1 hypothetical protein [Saccharothrix ecbatanensis]